MDARRPGDSVVKRCVSNALEMLGHMNGSRLGLDGTEFGAEVHGFATRNEADSVAFVVYRLEEGVYDPPAAPGQDITLEITNLPFRRFRATTYLIDHEHSNAYAHWQTKLRAAGELSSD